MGAAGDTTTNPRLLQQVAEWRDDEAWCAFFRIYDPFLRKWCGACGLRGGDLDELVQRVWIELATRLRTFRYDPSRKFRGWLRRLIQFRSCDFLRELRVDRLNSLHDAALGEAPVGCLPSPADVEEENKDAEISARIRARFELAGQAQAAVRARVAPSSWRAFELIAIEGREIGEAAELLGKKYAAVYRAHQRVARLLREEGLRLLREPSAGSSPTGALAADRDEGSGR